jgi:hypothetical protein
MSDHTKWGRASDALYTLHPRERAAEELPADNADEITCPHVLGLWNQDGHGLALQGSRRELLTYLRLVIDHVERETDPLEELDQALRRLHTLRAERAAAPGFGDHNAVTRLDEQEVSVLDDVAYAAEIVNDQL